MTTFRSLDHRANGGGTAFFAIAISACFVGCAQSSDGAATPRDAGVDVANVISPSYGYEDSGIVVGSGGDGVVSIDEDAAAPASVVINEVDYAQPSTDDHEFVELYNPSPTSAIDVSNMALTFVNSSSEYLRVSLSGSIPAHGFLVVADTAVTVPGTATAIRFTKASGNIRNGPDAIAIIDRTTASIIDALSYGGAIAGYVEGTPTSAVDSDTAAGALIRFPDGTDSNDAVNDWAFSTSATPGVANVKTP